MVKIKLPRFNDGDILHAQPLNEAIEQIEKVYDSVEDTKQEIQAVKRGFNKRIDNFYGKLIEIFGIFIAIFSFIIVGLQTSLSCKGDFYSRLACSTATFIPIVVVLVILILLIHHLKR